ncbi:serine O-acetyltransferase, putative [Babesia ovis]|uniref:Serine O-acetyltransferase, putative n=1 Tax=Babesia ovis TaxID=5869 RepID=A0A9W5TF17_BABOV|nr:serine O-acetyltransferase, putative [Babesia ovis]
MAAVSLLSDPKVASFYQSLSSSGELYCKRDLESMMKRFDIKTTKQRALISDLLDQGLLASERFKNITVLWVPARTTSIEHEEPPHPIEVEIRELTKRENELKRQISELESSLGNTNCLQEKCEAIRHEIDVLQTQNANKRDEVMRLLEAKRSDIEEGITR